MSVPDQPLDPPVVVIGDSVEARAVHRFLLKEAVRAAHVSHPDEALAVIEEAGVSAVVLDIDTNHPAAVELCHHVKRNSATRLTPVILLSDDRQKEHRLAGIDAGAEALLVKPFDPDELLARVRVASRVSQYTSDLDSAASIIMTVTAMIEARESSRGHCYRIGSGYPDGLKGDAVPELAQIVSIVDLFEAITMGREYVAPRSAAEAPAGRV